MGHGYLVHRLRLKPPANPPGKAGPLMVVVWFWLPFVLLVAELGSASERSATTTSSPRRSPERTSVQIGPDTPMRIRFVVGVPPRSTCTVWREPLVVTADVGTASPPFASPVTIDTVAVDPLLI